MADLRTLLAAVVGIGLGLVLLVAPAAVIGVQTVGRLPRDRGGKYGQAPEPPRRWLRIVRAIGALLILGGVYFGTVVVQSVGAW